MVKIMGENILIAKHKMGPFICDEPEEFELGNDRILWQNNGRGLVYKDVIPLKEVIDRPIMKFTVHATCDKNKGTIENAVQSGTISQNTRFVYDKGLKGGMRSNLLLPVV